MFCKPIIFGLFYNVSDITCIDVLSSRIFRRYIGYLKYGLPNTEKQNTFYIFFLPFNLFILRLFLQNTTGEH